VSANREQDLGKDSAARLCWARGGPERRSSKLRTRSSARRPAALSRDCLQIVAHDGASRCAASDHVEACASERSGGGFINGLPGFVTLEADGEPQTTALDIEDGRITAIYAVRNPDQLRQLH